MATTETPKHVGEYFKTSEKFIGDHLTKVVLYCIDSMKSDFPDKREELEWYENYKQFTATKEKGKKPAKLKKITTISSETKQAIKYIYRKYIEEITNVESIPEKMSVAMKHIYESCAEHNDFSIVGLVFDVANNKKLMDKIPDENFGYDIKFQARFTNDLNKKITSDTKIAKLLSKFVMFLSAIGIFSANILFFDRREMNIKFLFSVMSNLKFVYDIPFEESLMENMLEEIRPKKPSKKKTDDTKKTDTKKATKKTKKTDTKKATKNTKKKVKEMDEEDGSEESGEEDGSEESGEEDGSEDDAQESGEEDDAQESETETPKPKSKRPIKSNK